MAPALWVGQKYSGTLEGSGQLITEIRAAGGRAEILSADLAAPEGAATLAKQVREIVGARLDHHRCQRRANFGGLIPTESWSFSSEKSYSPNRLICCQDTTDPFCDGLA